MIRSYKIDFQEVKRKFSQLNSVEQKDALEHFAPGGNVVGGDYVVKCPWRSDDKEGSFRVNISTGCYNDFSTGDHGDVINFATKYGNCRQYAAADKLMNLICSDTSYFASYDYAKNEQTKPDHTLFIWKKSSPGRHRYLEEKGISLGNARVNVHKDLNRIVVPLTDTVPKNERELDIKALQLIKEDGAKSFNKPMRGMFHIASSYDCRNDNVIICEGYATARSIAGIYVDDLVIACMSCKNMKRVALRIRELLPRSMIVIAADNDDAGKKAAEETSQALRSNIQIIYPAQGKDFNDKELCDE